jgi:hypothetical protein
MRLRLPFDARSTRDYTNAWASAIIHLMPKQIPHFD